MARQASTYRGARRMRAKMLKLLWRALPRDGEGRTNNRTGARSTQIWVRLGLR